MLDIIDILQIVQIASLAVAISCSAVSLAYLVKRRFSKREEKTEDINPPLFSGKRFILKPVRKTDGGYIVELTPVLFSRSPQEEGREREEGEDRDEEKRFIRWDQI